jgi:ABC-type amino acid transport substrate-binding protein
MVHQVLPRDTAGEAAVMRRRRVLLAGAAGCLARLAPAAAGTLQDVRSRGRLTVAVYEDMPPFSADGGGIDVEIAQALAKALNVQLTLLRFHADENMNDDLRNMVWRGHYLGRGPADVLLHVPVDPPLMQANPRVQIFAPYFREHVMIARDLKRVPSFASLADLAGQRVAVAGQTLAGWLLIGAEGGRYRDQLVTTWRDGAAAAQALKDGEVAAAAGNASELQSVLRGDARFAIEPLPLPRMRDGWVVGCAVKREANDLAQALQAAMNELSRSGTLAQAFARANVDWREP